MPRAEQHSYRLAQPFTSAQAADAGISPKALRGPRFVRVFRDAYVSAYVEVSPRVLAQAALLVVPGAVLSHRTAAQARRLPIGILERAETLPHVTASRSTRSTPRRGITRHLAPLPPEHVTQTRWGPATSPARTYLDRAAELCFEDTVALGDAILRRGLASPADLERMVEWGGRRRGVQQAREALEWLDPRAESAMESWGRVRMRKGGLPAPELNAAIHDQFGTWLARPDFVWRNARLIVEYDGIVHLSEAQRRADAQRRALLTADGWTVVTLTADDVVRRPEAMVALIAGLLRRSA